MPLTITLGNISARAKGDYDSKVVTVTFTSDSSWTCPAGVTNLISLFGKGSAGGSDYPVTETGGSGATTDFDGQASPPYAQWSDVVTRANAIRSYAISRIGLYSSTGATLVSLVSVGVTDNTWTLTNPEFNWSGRKVTAVGSLYSFNGAPSSGNITGGVPSSGWYFDATVMQPGGAGSPSTGFSKTFPGGVYIAPNGYPANVTSFQNVTVTPGSTYAIVVPGGGFITLVYRQP